MDTVLYLIGKLLIRCAQTLPLRAVARLGRCAGVVAYWADRRHRRVAIENLLRAFPDRWTRDDADACAREHFRRLGESYCCALKTAAMPWSELAGHVEFVGVDQIHAWRQAHPTGSMIASIGHFGNFELYGRFNELARGFQCASTYRGLRQPGLNRLMVSLRERSGSKLFERRSEAGALRNAMSSGGLLLGLFADQHAGDRGLPLPFLGRVCSTSPAPALFALRYDAPLFVCVCYRVALASWRIEVNPFIATHVDGAPRPIADIMSDVNRQYEDAIRRDPANWFWVHNRWKPGKHRRVQPAPTDEAESDPAEEPSPLPGRASGLNRG
ncbi:MAG: lysophospholipid acyltransferase family protein [Verrucomicrobia bacterium]|nr:lysophospholipid acyltransferase family protein [Verrucomicrobiota bacterium]MBI3868125.1 lysophospholipid acyltransferase family protein [Verrucomicrobiota bacterium]